MIKQGAVMEHRVFNLQDVADYLHVRVEDVEELVRLDEIPFERHGNRLVFRRTEIEPWASRRILGYTPGRLSTYHKTSTSRMEERDGDSALIPDLLPPERIAPALPCRTKPSLIREMIRRADTTGLLILPDDLLQALEDRERQGSTALSGGVAMLHPGHNDPYLFEESFLILARTVQPIPFGSPDGRTTDIFFLICARDEQIHLHLLARLCMICHHTDALLHIREAERARDMRDILVDCERTVLRQESNPSHPDTDRR